MQGASGAAPAQKRSSRAAALCLGARSERRRDVALRGHQFIVVARGGLRPVGDADLPKNALEVVLHREEADLQRLRDVAVGAAPGDTLQDLALAVAERERAGARHGVRGRQVIELYSGDSAPRDIDLANEQMRERNEAALDVQLRAAARV